MGSMPGTKGLGAGSFVAVWAMMMAAMILPSVAPFASLYSRTFIGARGSRLGAFASGYLIVWTLAALPAYGLAWLASRLAGGHPTAATVLAVARTGAWPAAARHSGFCSSLAPTGGALATCGRGSATALSAWPTARRSWPS
jgi:predicted metal-binding membrane protein